MMRNETTAITLSLAVLVGGALAAGCDDDADPMAGPQPDGGALAACAPADPAAYVSPSFEANAAAELALRKRLADFLEPMRDAAADLALQPKAADLEALFAAGMPGLRALASPYYAQRVSALLAAFEAAAGKTWAPADPPPAAGGKFGPDIFSPDGVDLRQAIEKGLYGAAFYNHALTLMKGAAVTPETVDRLVALYGAHPSFPMSDNAMATPNPDLWTSQYAKRRTRKDAPAPGLYLQIKTDLVAAQAAAARGAACETTLRARLESFRKGWERTLLATTIYYANDAKLKLTKDNPTAAEVSGGLHSIAEGVSFAHGFRTLPAADRIIGDAQIDEILALFGAPAEAPATVFRFATDAAGQAPKLDQVIEKVRAIYGFSAEQVEQFKTNF